MTLDPETTRPTALILAAQRGPDEPIARAAGVGHKALVPVGGVPMLKRVVDAVRESGCCGRIVVSIDRAAVLAACPALARDAEQGRIEVLASRASAAASVEAAFDALAPPLLVTTADHALLTPDLVACFWRGVPANVDMAAGIVEAEIVRAAFPDARRTFLAFRDGAIKGANLFALLTPDARRVVAFWRRVESHRKRPLRLMARLGPISALGFALGLLTRGGAIRRLERRLGGVRIALVPLAEAEAAIDVDKPEDLALAEAVLNAREQRA